MFQRIIDIKDCKTCKQVLLQLCHSEDGSYVEISAWHVHPEEGDYYQVETITSGDEEILKSIIAYFPESAAINFAKSFTF